MANPDHLKILQEAIDKDDISIWNDWRIANPSIQPNLRSTKFEGLNLDSGDFTFTDFSSSGFFEVSLKQAKLQFANFSETYFKDVDGYKAYLDSANLVDAELNSTILMEANLANANMSGAKLISANLGGANLTEANSRNANFNNSNLIYANLLKTNLQKANLNEAHLNGTIFADVDLSTIRNLHKADIQGPCEISISTLYKSQKILGETWFQNFLRDCGVPETMVTYASSLVVKPIDYYSCFISYSSANEDFAEFLYDTLRGKNIRVWYAPEQILPGHNIKQEIIRGIQHWDKVILCCSESSLTEKWWVDFERTLAETKAQDLQRQYKQSIPVIIPLDLDGYVHDGYKKHKDYDPFLSSYHIADFRDWENHDSFKREVDRLIRALQTDDGREPPPPSKLKPQI